MHFELENVNLCVCLLNILEIIAENLVKSLKVVRLLYNEIVNRIMN